MRIPVSAISTCAAVAAVSLLLGGALPGQQPAQVVPNDQFFKDQLSFWFPGGTATVRTSSRTAGLRTITMAPGISLEMPATWAITTGAKSVVVAVIDDGFFYDHEDIAPNIWSNPGESGPDSLGLPKAANGKDDDGNGYADDVVGYDFAFDDPDPDGYVFDGRDRSRIQPYGHSISALGIIAARGNDGRGVAGIGWNTSLMLLKIGMQGLQHGAIDSIRTQRAARAIRYAVDNGARIINWSGFVSDTAQSRMAPLRAAVAYARDRGVLLVVGAGNDAKDLDDDTNCSYPQCFDEPNMIRVAELDFDGALAHFLVGDRELGSTFGKRRVEIAAIGQNFTSSFRNAEPAYSMSRGTSNAAPVVAGVAALMLAVNPALHAAQLRQLIMATATPLRALNGKIASGGTINAYRAVVAARQAKPDQAPSPGIPMPKLTQFPFGQGRDVALESGSTAAMPLASFPGPPR